MTFEEKTVSSERIYEGKIINVRRDQVTVENGLSYREIVEHSGGSVIAALTDDGQMIMVRQYRKPAERVMLEVPAGKIDPGEKPFDAAVRELAEETGYRAEHVELMTRMYPSVGYAEEVLYLYLATGLTPGETCFDENEAIDIEKYSVNRLYDMVMSGEIEDGKSQVAILMVKARFEAGRLQGYWKQPE
ncbi:NUDIX domain-containing protein [Ihubacter sp. rT4E-8]|uniref:NUDIX domain-containing protein n=1 Tax=unclassified Ihubacter TaxID=2633299 RepID=UPI00137966D2